MYWQRK